VAHSLILLDILWVGLYVTCEHPDWIGLD